MKVTIITVGKIHDPHLKSAIAEYETRLHQYIGLLNWELIPSSDISTEGARIIRKCAGVVILLDETGEMLTSMQLAKKVDTYQNESVKQITLIIGGAYGVSKDVIQRADFIWSLSQLVFPHQIVRLLLAEQLYRAFNILSGGKYHHS